MLLPQQLVPDVLRHLHDAMCHQGSELTTALVSARCYRPTVLQDVRSSCDNCERYNVAKIGPRVTPRMSHLFAVKPLNTLALDFTFVEK